MEGQPSLKRERKIIDLEELRFGVSGGLKHQGNCVLLGIGRLGSLIHLVLIQLALWILVSLYLL